MPALRGRARHKLDREEGGAVGAYTRRTFWLGAAERAVKTFAQAVVAAIGTAALLSEVNWAVVGSTAAVAALLSVLTSIADPKAADTAVVQG